jgi:hypothetical protein
MPSPDLASLTIRCARGVVVLGPCRSGIGTFAQIVMTLAVPAARVQLSKSLPAPN